MIHDTIHHRPTIPDTEATTEQRTTNTQRTHSTDGRLRKTALFVSMSIGQLMAAEKTNAQEEIPAPPPDVPAASANDDEGRRFSIESKGDAPPLEEVEKPALNEKVMSSVIRIMEDWAKKNEEEYKRALLAERALNGDVHALTILKSDSEFAKSKKSFRFMGVKMDPLHVVQSKFFRGLEEKAKALVNALNFLHGKDLEQPLTTEQVMDYQRAGLRLFIERENNARLAEIAAQENSPEALVPVTAPLTAIGEKDQ